MIQMNAHYLLRLRRDGPLGPARIQWLDHEPGEPGNPRDRWPALIPQVDICGEVRPPEELLERFSWGPPHWKSLQSISGAEYEHAFRHLRWAERNAPSHPTLRPRRRMAPTQIPLPSFDQENAI
jgi:hypothetical protein